MFLLIHGHSLIPFFLHRCDDLILSQAGFIKLNDHFQSMITGINLFDTIERILKGFEFHGAVGTGHIGDFEGFFDHSTSEVTVTLKVTVT